MNLTKYLKNKLSLTLLCLLMFVPSAYAQPEFPFEYEIKDYSFFEEKRYYSEDEYPDYDDDKEEGYSSNKYHKETWSDHMSEAKNHFRKRFKDFFRYIRRIRMALNDPDTDWGSFDWGFDHHDHDDEYEEGHNDEPEEGHNDEPEEGHSDEYEEGHSDEHEEGHSDEPEEGHNDEPEEGHNDEPEEGQNNDQEEGQNDESMPVQSVSVSNQPVGYLGDNVEVEVSYSTSDNLNQLSGLGLRVHFDSTVLTYNSLGDVLVQDNIVNGEGPISDVDDLDNNPQTDSYISFGWASLFNNWPNTELPAVLANITFGVSSTLDPDVITATDINFTAITTAAGYGFTSESYSLELAETDASWDYDGNGDADALTDGLIMMRYSFGLRGDTMAQGAISTDSVMSIAQVEERVLSSMKIADIDNDGDVDALTDGLLLLRHLFAMQDDSLVNGAVGQKAARKTKHAIKEHLNKYMPKKRRWNREVD